MNCEENRKKANKLQLKEKKERERERGRERERKKVVRRNEWK